MNQVQKRRRKKLRDRRTTVHAADFFHLGRREKRRGDESAGSSGERGREGAAGEGGVGGRTRKRTCLNSHNWVQSAWKVSIITVSVFQFQDGGARRCTPLAETDRGEKSYGTAGAEIRELT